MVKYCCTKHMTITEGIFESDDPTCPICGNTNVIIVGKPTTPTITNMYKFTKGYKKVGEKYITTLTRTCIKCGYDFEYIYIGGPKRKICKHCGGVKDE